MRVLLSLLVLVVPVASAQEPGKKALPRPLPEKVIKAWTDAGAQVGWLTINEFGLPQWTDKAAAGSVPGFRFHTWEEGVIAKLPAPESPFGLYLGGTQVTDAGLKELAGLKSLTRLDLWRTQVTDAGLKELAGLKSLTSLSLDRTQVTDAGLKELAGLKSLTRLDLRFTKVTDAGLKELAGLKSLTRLYLTGTQVTAKGVAELQKALPKCRIVGDFPGLPWGMWLLYPWLFLFLLLAVRYRWLFRVRLPEKVVKAWTDAGAEVGWLTVNKFGIPEWADKAAAGAVPGFRFGTWKEGVIAKLPAPESPFGLDLGFTQVTDAGLKELAGLKSLTTLNLNFTQVTDAGLKELAGLTSLTYLNLIGTKVTGAGLKELAGLKNLTLLDLGGTKVTMGGVTELQKALPKCRIIK